MLVVLQLWGLLKLEGLPFTSWDGHKPTGVICRKLPILPMLVSLNIWSPASGAFFVRLWGLIELSHWKQAFVASGLGLFPLLFSLLSSPPRCEVCGLDSSLPICRNREPLSSRPLCHDGLYPSKPRATGILSSLKLLKSSIDQSDEKSRQDRKGHRA